MVGTAVFTMVASSSSMKSAAQTTHGTMRFAAALSAGSGVSSEGLGTSSREGFTFTRETSATTGGRDILQSPRAARGARSRRVERGWAALTPDSRIAAPRGGAPGPAPLRLTLRVEPLPGGAAVPAGRARFPAVLHDPLAERRRLSVNAPRPKAEPLPQTGLTKLKARSAACTGR